MRAPLISSSPGAGKTKALATAVHANNISARIVTGNLNLAAEMAAEHGYALIQGRNNSNCERYNVVRALGSAGHDIEKLACGKPDAPRCPVRDRCLYFAQFQEPGPRVGVSLFADATFARECLSGH